MTTAIVPHTAQGWTSLQLLGRVLAESGYFKDVKGEAQAVTKIIAGREMGLGPIASLSAFHIIDGKVEASADLQARLLKRSGRYDYRVQEITNDACTIEFFERNGDEWESLGDSRYTIEDAVQAGASFQTERGNPTTWAKFPRNMLWARAMSNGVAWYCPDAVDARIYSEGEIGGEEALSEDDLAAPVSTITVPGHGSVDTTTGEIVEEGEPQPAVESAGRAAAEPGVKPQDSRVPAPNDADPSSTHDVPSDDARPGEQTEDEPSPSTEESGTSSDEGEGSGEEANPVDQQGEPSPAGTAEPPKPASPSTPRARTRKPPKATKAQMNKLFALVGDLGWDDDRRHAEAGVSSFTELTKERAGELIDAWETLVAEGSTGDASRMGKARRGSEGTSATDAPAVAPEHEHVWAPHPKLKKFAQCTFTAGGARCLATERREKVGLPA